MTDLAQRPAEIIASLHGRFGASHDVFGVLVDLAIMVSTADGIIDDGEYDNIAHSITAMAGTSLDKGMVRRIVGATLFDIKQEGLDARAAKVGRQLAEMAAVDEGLQFGVVIAMLQQGLSHDEAKVLEDVAVAAGKEKETIHTIADSFAK